MRKRTPLAVMLAATLSLLCVSGVGAVENVTYACDPPAAGTEPVLYRWYVCWPDSNTLTYYQSSSGTSVAIRPKHRGQRMRVQAIDADGHQGPVSIASDPWLPRSKTDVPEAGAWLLRSYPNPFNPLTTITFGLAAPGRARLEVYTISGERVRTLIDADLPAGAARAEWDGTDDAGRDLPSGGYLCRLSGGGRVQILRMLLVR